MGERARAWLRMRPFLAAVVLAILLLPVADDHQPLTTGVAAALTALSVGVCLLRPSLVFGERSLVVVALGAVVVVALLRDAAGGAASGYTALYVLPVVWVALHGGPDRRATLLVVAAIGVAVAAPLVVVGAPRYPATGWRQVAVLLAEDLLVGEIVRGLVGRLQLAATRSRAVVASMSEGLGITRDGVIVEANDALCAMTGFRRDELVGHGLPFPFWPPERHEEYARLRERLHADGGGRIEVELVRADGRRFPAEFTTKVLPYDDGGPPAYVSTMRDITDRRRVQDADRETLRLTTAIVGMTRTVAHADPSEARRAICETAVETVGATTASLWELDDDGDLRRTEIAGFGAAELDARPYPAPALLREAFVSGLRTDRADIAGEGVAHETSVALLPPGSGVSFQPIRVDASILGVLALAWPAQDAQLVASRDQLVDLLAAEAAVALVRAARHEALERQADTDALTGLLNRRAFRRAFEAEIARARTGGPPVSVAMLDLDRFKAYNDAHGHPGGDRLLREVAAAWRGRLRTADALSRWGGEEFCVVLPGCDGGAARRVVDDLRAAMPGGQTCSAGVATWHQGADASTLIAAADAALYAAKHEGRDRTVLHGHA